MRSRGTKPLLACTAAFGTLFGGLIWYFASRKGIDLAPRIKVRVDEIDFGRFRASSDLALMMPCHTSIPPVKFVIIAAGVINYPYWRYLAVTAPAV